MSASTLTKHAVLRLSQRGIRCDDLQLIQSIGTEVEGGFLVRQKDFQALERELKKLRDHARRLVGKRVVRNGDAVITAYHAGHAKERRLLRQGYDGG